MMFLLYTAEPRLTSSVSANPETLTPQEQFALRLSEIQKALDEIGVRLAAIEKELIIIKEKLEQIGAALTKLQEQLSKTASTPKPAPPAPTFSSPLSPPTPVVATSESKYPDIRQEIENWNLQLKQTDSKKWEKEVWGRCHNHNVPIHPTYDLINDKDLPDVIPSIIPLGKQDKPALTPVKDQGSFDAAAAIKKERPNSRIAILNFASSTVPGGNQEGYLCDGSSLEPSLLKRVRDNKSGHYIGKEGVLYTPDVTVWGNKLKATQKDFHVDVLSAAAPISPTEDTAYFQLMYNLLNNIFWTAYKTGETDLVLGGFGCGIFRNDATTVATIFKNLLDGAIPAGITIDAERKPPNGKDWGSYFVSVVFPMLVRVGNAQDNNNLVAFQKVFPASE